MGHPSRRLPLSPGKSIPSRPPTGYTTATSERENYRAYQGCSQRNFLWLHASDMCLNRPYRASQAPQNPSAVFGAGTHLSSSIQSWRRMSQLSAKGAVMARGVNRMVSHTARSRSADISHTKWPTDIRRERARQLDASMDTTATSGGGPVSARANLHANKCTIGIRDNPFSDLSGEGKEQGKTSGQRQVGKATAVHQLVRGQRQSVCEVKALNLKTCCNKPEGNACCQKLEEITEKTHSVQIATSSYDMRHIHSAVQ